MARNDEDHDVVVVDRGGNGGAVLLAVVVLVILVIAVWFFALGPGQGTFTGSDGGVDINVELPSVAPGAS